VTGSWTRIEVSGALIRAARRDQRVDADTLIASLDADLAAEGLITVVGAPANAVEASALELVRRHGLRTLDAWHLATASLTVPNLAGRGEPIGFASRDESQSAVAESLGFIRI
jgi:predicted nucleic acid-binding protein